MMRRVLQLSLLASAESLACPSFSNFISKVTGDWQGSKYSWSTDPSDEDNGFIRCAGICSPQPWFISLPEPAGTTVEEVMRSCGGAVQGVRELRENGGEAVLNRADDGFTFFDDGSYMHGPTLIGNNPELQFGDTELPPNTMGLTACLQHSDGSRRRLLLAVVGGKLEGAEVVVEGRSEEGSDGKDGKRSCLAAEQILAGKLQVVAEAAAWEGGAHENVLEASVPSLADPWIMARVKWTTSGAPIAGGSALLPEPTEDVTFLPGGCWFSSCSSQEGKAFVVSVGSMPLPTGGGGTDDDLFTGEVKVLTRTYDEKGSLRASQLRHVFPEP